MWQTLGGAVLDFSFKSRLRKKCLQIDKFEGWYNANDSDDKKS